MVTVLRPLDDVPKPLLYVYRDAKITQEVETSSERVDSSSVPSTSLRRVSGREDDPDKGLGGPKDGVLTLRPKTTGLESRRERNLRRTTDYGKV